MKKLFFISLALFFVLSSAYASKADKIFKVKGDSLFVYNKTASYVAPPKMVPIDTAVAIMRTGYGQYMTEKYIKQPKFFFRLTEFVLKTIKGKQQQTFIYDNGVWKSKLPTFKFNQPIANNGASIVLLYLPFVCILAVGIIGYKRKKQLLFFYLAILVSMLLGIIIGSDYASIIIGGLVGGLMGGLALGNWSSVSMFMGYFIGGSTSGLVSVLAGNSDNSTIISYFIVVIVACLVSFILASKKANLVKEA